MIMMKIWFDNDTDTGMVMVWWPSLLVSTLFLCHLGWVITFCRGCFRSRGTSPRQWLPERLCSHMSVRAQRSKGKSSSPSPSRSVSFVVEDMKVRVACQNPLGQSWRGVGIAWEPPRWSVVPSSLAWEMTRFQRKGPPRWIQPRIEDRALNFLLPFF